MTFRSDMDDPLSSTQVAQAEIVRLNNQDCERLRLINDLRLEIERICAVFCKEPAKLAAYKAAMKALGN